MAAANAVADILDNYYRRVHEAYPYVFNPAYVRFFFFPIVSKVKRKGIGSEPVFLILFLEDGCIGAADWILESTPERAD